jgi:hypothetical protein
MLSFMYT